MGGSGARYRSVGGMDGRIELPVSALLCKGMGDWIRSRLSVQYCNLHSKPNRSAELERVVQQRDWSGSQLVAMMRPVLFRCSRHTSQSVFIVQYRLFNTSHFPNQTKTAVQSE